MTTKDKSEPTEYIVPTCSAEFALEAAGMVPAPGAQRAQSEPETFLELAARVFNDRTPGAQRAPKCRACEQGKYPERDDHTCGAQRAQSEPRPGEWVEAKHRCAWCSAQMLVRITDRKQRCPNDCASGLGQCPDQFMPDGIVPGARRAQGDQEVEDQPKCPKCGSKTVPAPCEGDAPMCSNDECDVVHIWPKRPGQDAKPPRVAPDHARIELSFQPNPVCPHCGHVEKDAWEIDFGCGLDGDTETSCGSCGEDYFCSRYCSVSYSTAKLQEKP